MVGVSGNSVEKKLNYSLYSLPWRLMKNDAALIYEIPVV